MKNNRKKVFLVLFVLGIIFSIINYFGAQSTAQATIDIMQKIYGTSIDLSSNFFNVDFWTMLISISNIIFGVFNAVLLVMFLTNNFSKQKGLVKGLMIANIFVGTIASDFQLLFSIIELILFTSKNSWDNMKNEEKNEKSKKDKDIKKLKTLKLEKKDYILSVILIICYCGLMFSNISFGEKYLDILYVLFVYLFLFLLAIFVLRKTLKRDFSELRKNAKGYFKHSLKYWGLMYLAIFLVTFIKILVTNDAVSGNQEVLNSLPLWYVVPLSVIWAPIVEESIFRGSFRRFIKNDVVFIVVSALAFGLLHTLSSETELLGFIFNTIVYGTMGGFLACVYTKTNNMCSNILMHAFQNLLGSILMILTAIL